MISFLIVCGIENDLKHLYFAAKKVSSEESDDDWNFILARTVEMAENGLAKEPILDFACVDLTLRGGISGAKMLRSANSNTSILVVVDGNLSPAEYIIPEIMASSLLIRPFDDKTAKKVISIMVRSYLARFDDKKEGQNVFVVDCRSERRLIPYSLISCFEAREKKITLSAEGREYSFYDTIDNLESGLPKQFIRCHRSFIEKIVLSQSRIDLKDGSFVPLSRSYRQKFDQFRSSLKNEKKSSQTTGVGGE